MTAGSELVIQAIIEQMKTLYPPFRGGYRVIGEVNDY